MALKCNLSRGGDALTVALTGNLDDTIDQALKDLRGKIGEDPRVVFDCAKVGVINSLGLSLWVRFLEGLGERKIELVNCPSVFIDYCNMTASVIGPADIVSFYVPYRCQRCRHDVQSLLPRAKADPDAPFGTLPCPKCNADAVAVVDSEDYLAFLKAG